MDGPGLLLMGVLLTISVLAAIVGSFGLGGCVTSSPWSPSQFTPLSSRDSAR